MAKAVSVCSCDAARDMSHLLRPSIPSQSLYFAHRFLSVSAIGECDRMKLLLVYFISTLTNEVMICEVHTNGQHWTVDK